MPLLFTARTLLIAALLLALLPAAPAALAAPLGVTLLVNLPLNLPVNSTAAITDELLYAIGDIPSQTVFTLTANVSAGVLKLNDTPLAQGGTFTQEDILDLRLSYTAPATISTASFTFTVHDSGGTSPVNTFIIHINKPTPTAYPEAFTATAGSVSRITVAWDAPVGGPAPDGFLVLCAPLSPPNLPHGTETPVDNPCTDGSGSAHLAPTARSYTWEGLNSETVYYFAIHPYARTAYPGGGEYTDYYTGGTPPQAQAATFKTYSISGMVTDSATGAGLMSLRVQDDQGHSALTGEDGSYTLVGLVPGNYTVSTSALCYTAAPASRAVTVSEAQNHPGGVDFTATRWPCITGSVYAGVTPLAGVTISDGASLSAVTGGDGTYALPVTIGHWSGRLQAQKPGYYFTPERRVYIDVTADVTLQGYGAHLVPVYPQAFAAGWNAVPGATGFTLDISTDPSFDSFVPGFEALEVGPVTEYFAAFLAPGATYYYRVRPHDLFSSGEASVPVEVTTLWGFYFPVAPR